MNVICLVKILICYLLNILFSIYLEVIQKNYISRLESLRYPHNISLSIVSVRKELSGTNGLVVKQCYYSIHSRVQQVPVTYSNVQCCEGEVPSLTLRRVKYSPGH